MIDGTKQLIENLLELYDNFDDNTANSYILSFVLLRVGCLSKSYDFQFYSQMNREERESFIEQVSFSLFFFSSFK